MTYHIVYIIDNVEYLVTTEYSDKYNANKSKDWYYSTLGASYVMVLSRDKCKELFPYYYWL